MKKEEIKEIEDIKEETKEKRNWLGNTCLIMIIVLLLLLLLTRCNGISENSNGLLIGNGSTTTEGFKSENYEALKKEVEEKNAQAQFGFNVSSRLTFDNVKSKGNLRIASLATNNYNLLVHVFVEGYEEPVYASPIILPSEYIEEDYLLNQTLLKGEYEAIARLNILDENNNIVSTIDVKTILDIRN